MIVGAIQTINEFEIDALIVARGGGSLLLLGVGWTWGPRIFRKLGGLFKRG